MFGKKLCYLMILTNTTNTELAKYIPLSESCISRWKNGKRSPTKSSNYIKIISKYFADKIKSNKLEYNFNNIFKFNNDEEFQNNLEIWLKDNTTYLENTSTFVTTNVDSIFYYGDKGKQDAVIRFLNNAKNKSNHTLLLYSDESISWLLDENFAPKWSSLLIDVLKNGNKIRIIHTIAREYNEIFEAVSKWIPMYLSGKIEPYYFNKLRDGIIRTTLFISLDDAIISNSVENKTNNMLNIYITDKNAISALKKQFNNYLSLCKPLINIFTNFQSKNLIILDKPTNSNLIIDSYSLSFISIPNDIIVDVFSCENKNSLIIDYLNKKNVLLDNLKKYFVLDILNIATSFSNTIPYTFINKVYYTRENYIKHLKNILNMLTTYKNYYVVLKFDELTSNSIYIKEDSELIVEKNNNSCLLISNEKNIIKAFWEHYILKKQDNKKETIKKIKNIIKSMS